MRASLFTYLLRQVVRHIRPATNIELQVCSVDNSLVWFSYKLSNTVFPHN